MPSIVCADCYFLPLKKFEKNFKKRLAFYLVICYNPISSNNYCSYFRRWHMSGKRYSRQRELIYERLRNTTEHPTAEMLYQWLKPDNPALSLGTVYRNLNLLADDGVIARMAFPVERYDACITPHTHLLCRTCGSVYDLELPYDEALDKCAQADSTHLIEGHELLFIGTCANCSTKH